MALRCALMDYRRCLAGCQGPCLLPAISLLHSYSGLPRCGVTRCILCRLWEQQYSKFTAMLPTRAFLAPMDEDEEIEVELAKGNSVIIKYKALSELQPNGKRWAAH